MLRLPHAGGSAQFHDTLFLIVLKSWLVVAVPSVRCYFDGSGGRPRVGLSLRDRKSLFAQHTNDKSGSFDVVRFDWDICVLCPASVRARLVARNQAIGGVGYSFSHVLVCL